MHVFSSTGITLSRKWWTRPGFIASKTSDLYNSCIQFNYIDSNMTTKQTNIIGNNVTESQQSIS